MSSVGPPPGEKAADGGKSREGLHEKSLADRERKGRLASGDIEKLASRIEATLYKNYTNYADIKEREDLLVELILADPSRGLNMLSRLRWAPSCLAVLYRTIEEVPSGELREWGRQLAGVEDNISQAKMLDFVGLLGDNATGGSALEIYSSLAPALSRAEKSAFFQRFANRDLEAAKALAEQMTNKSDRGQAMKAIGEGLLLNNRFDDSLKFIADQFEGDSAKELLIQASQRAFEFSDGATAEQFCELLDRHGFRTEAAAERVNMALLRGDGAGAIALIAGLNQQDLGRLLESDQIGNTLSLADSGTALEILGKLDITAKNSAVASGLLYRLIKEGKMEGLDSRIAQDPKFADAVLQAATKFARETGGEEVQSGAAFPPNLGACVAAAQVRNYLSNLNDKAQGNSFKGAWELVNRLPDSAVKERVSGEVWEKERSALRSEVGKNPQEAIDGIVKGSSGFADYWLEEAVGTWVAKDFDSAIAWYDKTWKSLPESKSQYVAAAFATQSLRQKDVDAARQWAALIRDAKTRGRIEAAIAKAGGK
jgi:hypothetical protein